MKQESGRSLIEVIGVMAIAGLMTVSAIGVYNMLRKNQVRMIADAELEQIAQNTKMLLEMRGSYEGVSIDYLIKAGALQSDTAPIGGDAWSVVSSADGKSFSINLVDLTTGECDYFATSKPKWASAILVNGFETGLTDNCFDSNTNQISFIVE
ncbi:MAG: type II secretion system protein [Alphaproteobacteria bacterium]